MGMALTPIPLTLAEPLCELGERGLVPPVGEYAAALRARHTDL